MLEVDYVEPPVQFKNDETPNDLHLNGNQWYLTKIQAENAWDIEIGSSNIRIAIIEGHGVGDHIDVNNKFVAGETGSTGDHGIMVAGVAGAETDNSSGIASLGWNISLVRMNGSNGTGIAPDIRNSADPNLSHQADIINCSFKTVWVNTNGTYYSYNYSVVEDAVEDAQAFEAIIVASAGNPPKTAEGDLDVVPFTQWPAAYTDVIGVSATDISDQFPSDYNYGSHVDVSAPSISILTTGVNNSYVSANGTSFGSPLVAALAGLILSIDPSLSNSDVIDIIQSSAEDLGDPGRDDYFGFGRINALRSVVNSFILANPNYSFSESSAPLSLYQSNQWKWFDCSPAEGIPPGNYYVDIYKTEIITDDYVDINNGWYLGVKGYYPGSPITCEPYIYRNIVNNELTLRTYYYYIKINLGGDPVYQWAPVDPNPSSMRKYGVLGEPSVPPIFDPVNPFIQNPNPICKGTSGTLTVNLLQGNGDLNYDWYSTNEPSHINTVFMGNSCMVTYLNTDNHGGDGPTWDFGCTVWNSLGSVTKTADPLLDPNCPGSSCPTLSFEADGEMIDENPLLITSLSNPGTDVTDYYLINTPIEPNGEEINFTIHEPQTEHTWLDYVELIEVKVKSDELVAVNDEGEVINYKMGLPPVTVILNGETDITEILAEFDTLNISLSEGDVLTIFREGLSPEGGSDGDIVLSGIKPIIKVESLSISLTEKKDSDGGIKSNVGDNPPLGGFFFRENKSTIAKSLKNFPPGNLDITISQVLVLDYLALVKNIKTAQIKTLDLLNAEHDQRGDVKGLLSGVDQDYAEIYPGEEINFTFRKGNTPAEKTAYILRTVGSYETDSSFIMLKGKNLTGTGNEIIIPLENKLFDNYPNPFNPVTQIKYSIKEDSPVSIKVYDILGNEVAVLVNKEQLAGNYTVEFEAGKFASGVYLYSISSKDFYKVKKMILLK